MGLLDIGVSLILDLNVNRHCISIYHLILIYTIWVSIMRPFHIFLILVGYGHMRIFLPRIAYGPMDHARTFKTR